MDRVRNEYVRRRPGVERDLANRADKRVLRQFGCVERMDEQVPYGQKGVDGGNKWRAGTGRPWLVWIDGVKVAAAEG